MSRCRTHQTPDWLFATINGDRTENQRSKSPGSPFGGHEKQFQAPSEEMRLLLTAWGRRPASVRHRRRSASAPRSRKWWECGDDFRKGADVLDFAIVFAAQAVFGEVRVWGGAPGPGPKRLVGLLRLSDGASKTVPQRL